MCGHTHINSTYCMSPGLTWLLLWKEHWTGSQRCSSSPGFPTCRVRDPNRTFTFAECCFECMGGRNTLASRQGRSLYKCRCEGDTLMRSAQLILHLLWGVDTEHRMRRLCFPGLASPPLGAQSTIVRLSDWHAPSSNPSQHASAPKQDPKDRSCL